jgi:hypothetical protein
MVKTTFTIDLETKSACFGPTSDPMIRQLLRGASWSCVISATVT